MVMGLLSGIQVKFIKDTLLTIIGMGRVCSFGKMGSSIREDG